MNKTQLVVLQARTLAEHEGKYVLLQSNYYPIGQGSLYLFRYENTETSKLHGRDPHVLIDIDPRAAYKRHAFSEGVFEGLVTKWRSFGSVQEGQFFPIRLEDTIFLLNEETSARSKISHLTTETRQLTVDDLIDQFPKAKQIWPVE